MASSASPIASASSPQPTGNARPIDGRQLRPLAPPAGAQRHAAGHRREGAVQPPAQEHQPVALVEAGGFERSSLLGRQRGREHLVEPEPGQLADGGAHELRRGRSFAGNGPQLRGVRTARPAGDPQRAPAGANHLGQSRTDAQEAGHQVGR